jgi:hypothetical protein
VSKRPLAGRYDSDWNPTLKSTCVTGDAQISLCWMDVYRITNNTRFLNAALKMNDFLKAIQLFLPGTFIHGALPQSYPFWGDYGPYKINSWGIKYYIDALIDEYAIKKQFQIS